MKWENTTNETVLEACRKEIRRNWRRTCEDNKDHPRAAELFDPEKLPAFHDPFAGGGSIPLEAQRLGLEAYASDLNPVAVLINKAMIEIPPKFAGKPPVNPETQQGKGSTNAVWKGVAGLAEDVRYYGKWMRDEAEKRIGHLYPNVEVTANMVRERPDLKPYLGRKLTVIAWLWARTVKSPNPAFADVDVPLASTFTLSTKKGKEAYVEPVIEKENYRFIVKAGTPPGESKAGTTAGKRSAFLCLMSGVPVTYGHIRAEGKAGVLGVRLMAIVAEGDRGRVYLSPTPEHEIIALSQRPTWKPELPIPANTRDFKTPLYGIQTFGDLFTNRQLVALTTFSDLMGVVRERIRQDAVSAGMMDDGRPLNDGGTGATGYSEAVGIYLAFAIDRMAMTGNSLVRWNPVGQKAQHCFGRQALPMIWDFAEPNFLAASTGSARAAVFYSCDPLNWMDSFTRGQASQEDAVLPTRYGGRLVSTDPPYYDNIGYADLSDFFYIWLRRSHREVFPELFSTLAVPKAEELFAAPYRHGSREKAEQFFLDGMKQAIHSLADQTHPAFPVSIYYAYKQSEKSDEGITSSGWETFLDAVIGAGLGISGTWPIRTEMRTRQVGRDSNALASSIVLVCRPLPTQCSHCHPT